MEQYDGVGIEWTSPVASLEAAPVGPMLAALLASVELHTLTDDEALTYAQAWARLQAWCEAGGLGALAQFATTRARLDEQGPVRPGRERMVQPGGAGTPMVEEFAAGEVGGALRMSTAAAVTRLGEALALRHRLRGTWAALCLGVLDAARARLLARLTRPLSPEAAAAVEAEVLDLLPRLTLGRCERRILEAITAADPDGAEQRREAARTTREVVFGPSVDGCRDLFARLGAGGATRLDARVDQVADWLGELGDLDHKPVRRATALELLADPPAVELLWERVQRQRAGAPGAADTEGPAAAAVGDDGDPGAAATDADSTTAWTPRGPTSTGVALPTTMLYLHGRRAHDGAERWELEGVGPLTAGEAAELVGHSNVTVRPVIDLARVAPSAGYQPSETLAEATRLVHPYAVFPFSTAESRRCDLDHRVPWPVGGTALDNLGPLQRGHHRLRTHGRWRVDSPCLGTYVWTSPTGRRYRVDGHGTVELPRQREHHADRADDP